MPKFVIKHPIIGQDLELIRMMRMLSSDEQMEIYKSAFDDLTQEGQWTILTMIERLQTLRNMGIQSSYELLMKLGNFLNTHVEHQN